MGTEFTATAVLGCEVTGKLHRSIEVSQCAHPIGEGARFCSVCGKPTEMLRKEVPMPFFDDLRYKIGDLKVVCDGFRKRHFVGFVVKADQPSGSFSGDGVALLPLLDLGLCLDLIRSTLEPIGLYDPKTFGLWSILTWD